MSQLQAEPAWLWDAMCSNIEKELFMNKVKFQDVEIYYELQGESGEPVFFLNGIAMSVSHWNPLISQLKKKYTIVLHDFRDQLLSEKTDIPYSLETHADDLEHLMEKLDFESAHIVGTSYGSEVGMTFALKYPHRCKSLTIIDGVSELDSVLETAVDSWKSAALVDPRVFYRTLIPWNYSPAYLKKNLAALRKREEKIAQLPIDFFQGFARLCDAFLEINLTSIIHKIQCPVLILIGELDILKHKAFSDIMAREIPHSRLIVIPDAGHAVVIEKPAETAGQVESFIN